MKSSSSSNSVTGSVIEFLIHGPETVGKEGNAKWPSEEKPDPRCPPAKKIRQEHPVDVKGANDVKAIDSHEQIWGEFLGNGCLGEGQGSNDVSPSTSKSKVLIAASDAAKAVREQKAAKSDDAAVPEHSWEERLFDKSGWAEKWKDDQEGFQNSCRFLKSKMICWWKRTVTRSLGNWIDCQHPHMREKFDASKPLVKLESPHVRKQFVDSKPVLMLENDKCSWSKGGRVECVKWCNVRMSDTCIDLMPGSDAAAWAANLTWFEWDDGSCPFHWRWPGFCQKSI